MARSTISYKILKKKKYFDLIIILFQEYEILIKGKYKTKGIRVSSHSITKHSYDFVTSFETFDSWSNLDDLSCHINTFSNKKICSAKGEVEDFSKICKICNMQPSERNSVQ